MPQEQRQGEGGPIWLLRCNRRLVKPGPPMNMFWIYDIPNWLFCLITLAFFTGVSILALLLTRPYMHRLLKDNDESNDMVSFYLSAFGVFYGLTIGLIAVATWENFSSVDANVSQEASAISACYMDISRMPAPHAQELQGLMKEYVRYTIEDAWPIQQKGQIPKGGTERLTAFYDRLLAYEPTTESQKILLAEAVMQFNKIVELRRQRLQAVPSGLPPVIWIVVLVGAFLNIVLTLFFVTENLTFHVWMTTLLASLIGLLVFLIAAMDYPFRGEFSVSPEALEIIYDRFMATPAGK